MQVQVIKMVSNQMTSIDSTTYMISPATKQGQQDREEVREVAAMMNRRKPAPPTMCEVI